MTHIFKSNTNSPRQDQIRLIRLALEVKDWKTFELDHATIATVCATQNLGIIMLNDLGQFKLCGTGVKAQQFLQEKG